MPIKLPDPLTAEEKRKIKAAYEEAIITSGSEEQLYVKNKFSSFLARFQSPRGHKLLVIKISSLFYNECFRSSPDSGDILSEKAKTQVISALFYVINPYDVIPDFIPGRGYLDDAHAINLCLGKLKSSAPHIYNQAENIILEQEENTLREQQSEHL